MCLIFQWLQMSLRSLHLLSVRSLVLRILPCIPWCFHLLHAGPCRSIWKTLWTSLQVLTPHPRHHSPWTSTLDHSLLPFLRVYFFIARRLSINNVAQQCHITRVCLRTLYLFGSIIILFFILDCFSCLRWIYCSLCILLKIFLSLWCLWHGNLQVPLLNCRCLFFGMIYKSSLFSWLETYHNFLNILIVTNICHISMRLFYPMLHVEIINQCYEQWC